MIGEYCLTVHQCILADIDPAIGKMGIQNESAAVIFPYILWYILALLAQKKPLQILVHIITCLQFLVFFTKFLHIIIYGMYLDSIKQTHALKNRKSMEVHVSHTMSKHFEVNC